MSESKQQRTTDTLLHPDNSLYAAVNGVIYLWYLKTTQINVRQQDSKRKLTKADCCI